MQAFVVLSDLRRARENVRGPITYETMEGRVSMSEAERLAVFNTAIERLEAELADAVLDASR